MFVFNSAFRRHAFIPLFRPPCNFFRRKKRSQRDYIDVDDYVARDIVNAVETLRTAYAYDKQDSSFRYEREEVKREMAERAAAGGPQIERRAKSPSGAEIPPNYTVTECPGISDDQADVVIQ